MFKRVGFGTKLLLFALAASVIPMVVIGWLGLSRASDALERQAYDQLTATRDMKKRQVEAYFDETMRLMGSVRHDRRFGDGAESFDVVIADGVGSDYYNVMEEEWGATFERFMKTFRFDDLYLINMDGTVVYSVTKQDDVGTSLKDGPYAQSGLADAYTNGLEQRAFVDFAYYEPHDRAAAFVATPVHDANGEQKGVAAFMISSDAINDIMVAQSGLGESGETYLVGPDHLMRSNAKHHPQEHSTVTASMQQDMGVDTEATRQALSGETGSAAIENYRGTPVLSAYTPVSVPGGQWALVAEVSRAEAFAAVQQLRWVLGMAGLIALGVIVVVNPLLARILTRSVTNPLQRVIEGMTQASEQVNTASEQVSRSSQALADGISQQAAGVEETSSTMEELASMTRQNAENTKQADVLAEQARSHTEQGSEAMQRMAGAINEIKSSSDQTAKIIGTIDEIAFQTNLLALNAAVEAARAGDAGKGFAVVAEEVRNLAQRSAEAARDTTHLLEEARNKADAGVEVVREVEQSLTAVRDANQKVNDLIREVATASGEQTEGIEQVNASMANADQLTQGNAASAEQMSATATTLSDQAEQLHELVDELTRLVGRAGRGNGKNGDHAARNGGNGQAALTAGPTPHAPSRHHALPHGERGGQSGNGGSLRARIEQERDADAAGDDEATHAARREGEPGGRAG